MDVIGAAWVQVVEIMHDWSHRSKEEELQRYKMTEEIQRWHDVEVKQGCFCC